MTAVEVVASPITTGAMLNWRTSPSSTTRESVVTITQSGSRVVVRPFEGVGLGVDRRVVLLDAPVVPGAEQGTVAAEERGADRDAALAQTLHGLVVGARQHPSGEEVSSGGLGVVIGSVCSNSVGERTYSVEIGTQKVDSRSYRWATSWPWLC